MGSTSVLNWDVNIPSWFWHDSIGYIVLPRDSVPTGLILKAEKRSGNWSDLDHRENKNAFDTANIFQLSINHGAANGWKDTTYRYILLPGISKSDLAIFFDDTILSHKNTSLQLHSNNHRVVAASYKNYTGIFFTDTGYTKSIGLGQDSLTISVNSPVGILVNRKEKSIDMHVADIVNNFNSENHARIGINRLFEHHTFVPLHSNGSFSVIPSIDTSAITVTLSKTDEIYIGEPVNMTVTEKGASNARDMDAIAKTADSNVNLKEDKRFTMCSNNMLDNLADGLVIYPNPATNICMIKSKRIITKVILYSADGQSVRKMNNIFSSECNLSLLGLPIGTYFLTIEGTNSHKNGQIVKVR